MLIIAVIAGVSIRISKAKFDSVITYTYYSAYETLRNISGEIIANSYSTEKNNVESGGAGSCQYRECPFGYAFNKDSCDCVSLSVTIPKDGNSFCNSIEEYANVLSSNCSGSSKSEIDKAVDNSSFAGLQPDIVLRNGMKLYNVKNDFVEIPQLEGNLKVANNPFSVIATLYNKFIAICYNFENWLVKSVALNDSIMPAAHATSMIAPGGVGFQCIEGYHEANCRFINGRRICDCIPNCQKVCASGYYLDVRECVCKQQAKPPAPVCNKTCISHCSNCDKCTGICSSCESGYELSGGVCRLKTCNASAVSACTSSGGSMSSYPSCSCSCPQNYKLQGNSCVKIVCNSADVSACSSSGGSMSSYPECKCKCSEPYESTGANTCKKKTCNADAVDKCGSSGGNMMPYPDCNCYCPAGMFLTDGKCVTTDEGGYIIYIDVDGDKGDSILYEDVFPFYVTLSGMVVPGYPDGLLEAGGNSNVHMAVSVQYDDYSSGSRKKNWIVKSKSFKEAACKAGYVKTSAYCGSIKIDNKCKSDDADCRLEAIKPIKI